MFVTKEVWWGSFRHFNPGRGFKSPLKRELHRRKSAAQRQREGGRKEGEEHTERRRRSRRRAWAERMTPGVEMGIGDEEKLEKQIEKQMGCMAGFLHIFDRHQGFSAKRVYSTRLLPPSLAAGSTSPSGRSEASSAASFMKESKGASPSPDASPSSPELRPPIGEAPPRPSLPLPLSLFDLKDGAKTAWKIREGPRLSLDSRAVVDAKGKLRPREIRTPRPAPSDASDATDEGERQRRSPSVVARLMGLEALPGACDGEAGPPELRRSASESRVPRDPSYYRFVDASSFHRTPLETAFSGEGFLRRRSRDPSEIRAFRNSKPDPAPRAPHSPLQRKSFFDAQDVFPEPVPKRTGSISLYGEIERRLRMRGIDEPSKDLETLKQILEALQLKGLLHNKPSDHRIDGSRIVVYGPHPCRIPGDSPIVVMKPAPRPPRRPEGEQLHAAARPGPARRGGCGAAATSPRRDRVEIDRSLGRCSDRSQSPRSPSPSSPVRSPSSPLRRRSLINAESQRNAQPQRRIPAPHSAKSSPRRLDPDSTLVRSPVHRKPVPDRVCSAAYDDTAASISDGNYSSPSQFDFESSSAEEFKSGRNLLERCDKLLNSIAAITSGDNATAVDQQPSPVSVLDSSFLGDETSPSPSSVAKRAIHFKADQLADWEETRWSQEILTVGSDPCGFPESDDPDFIYVADILRSSDPHRDPSDLCARREKRHQPTGSTCLHRRLVFDAVTEILDRKRHVSPWDAFTRSRSLASNGSVGKPLLRSVWAEFLRVRAPIPCDDLLDVTCGAFGRDVAEDLGWAHPSAELSDAVLQIERQIFKDLVADTITVLADLAADPRPFPRRKLVF
ncbi:protein LONGIFOLIA 1-like isoform X2 [Ananas comosus]|uniref:Protein LONGIFOLIA 1-like isoform X2 n=1 Tax=Ananas comosus TaxID=4615 RepID=A0A6P5GA69_ANACO|nr:protein LONGIFOLIA 1-like isoform X2 [Ananas comosus]